MCAAVDDVHHGHGEHVCVATADIFVEGKVEVVGSGLGNGERNTEDGVGTEVRFCVCTVEGKHCLVNLDLVESAHAYESLGDRTVNVGDCLENAFTHVTVFVTVAEFESFVHAC